MTMMDTRAFAEFSELMGDSLPAIIEAYQTMLRDGIARMQAAFAAGDLATIGQLAHSMKSSTKQMGFSEFAELLRELERANQENAASAAAKLEKAETMAEQALSELAKHAA